MKSGPQICGSAGQFWFGPVWLMTAGSLLCLSSAGGSSGGLVTQIGLARRVAVGRLLAGAAGATRYPGGWLTQASSCGDRVPRATVEPGPSGEVPLKSLLCHICYHVGQS